MQNVAMGKYCDIIAIGGENGEEAGPRGGVAITWEGPGSERTDLCIYQDSALQLGTFCCV